MYVKIIKCSDDDAWYLNMIDLIYPVINCDLEEYKSKYQIEGTLNFLEKKDCKIINFNPDQISEKMADKLFDLIKWHFSDTYVKNIDKDVLFHYWKEKGYIKQNREDEIREKLGSNNILSYEIIELQKELIKIYENKIKELEDEIE